MDKDEVSSHNEEVSVIDRARATIARTRERHRRRMMENADEMTSSMPPIPTEIVPPEIIPVPPEMEEEEEEEVVLYENRIPDKVFLSQCRKLCRALNQRLKRERKSTKIIPRSIEDLNRDVVLFRHIVAQHIRQDSSTTLKPIFVKGKDVQELRAYLEEHFKEEAEQSPPPYVFFLFRILYIISSINSSFIYTGLRQAFRPRSVRNERRQEQQRGAA